jgi:protein SCO1
VFFRLKAEATRRKLRGGRRDRRKQKNVNFFCKTLTALATTAALMAAAPVRAQTPRPGGQEPGDPATAKPGIDQQLNAQVPLDLMFKDETGRDVRLGEFFGKRPVVLALVYYECPMLCTQVLNGAVSALSVLTFDVGKEYDVIAVSINRKEGPGLAAQKKKAYLERYKRPGTADGWHFLTGKEANIKQLADAVGFRYAFDEEIQQYAHGAGIEILTPRGVIAKYFYGIEFSPRDLKFGLIEASDERIGSVVDSALMLCYHYDPSTGRYGAAAIGAVRIGAVATMVAFFSFLFVTLRRERASHRDATL